MCLSDSMPEPANSQGKHSSDNKHMKQSLFYCLVEFQGKHIHSYFKNVSEISENKRNANNHRVSLPYSDRSKLCGKSSIMI